MRNWGGGGKGNEELLMSRGLRLVSECGPGAQLMTAKAGRQFVGGSRRRMRLGKYYLGRYSTMLEIFSRQ